MGHLLSSILLAISSNVDNFAIGIAYGVKKLKIGFLSNLSIAVVSALGTYISMTLGAIIAKFISDELANILGSIALVILGVWGLIEALRTENPGNKNQVGTRVKQAVPAGSFESGTQQFTDETDVEQFKPNNEEVTYATYIEDPDKADLDHSRSIDVKESIALAFALSINNVFSGIGAGLSKLDVNLTTALTFVLSIVAIVVGYFLGDKFTTKMSVKLSGVLSACLIICIGLYEYFH
jgi:putative Mn2+ efflux pump MntP